MLISLVMLLAGLALLIGGGDALVRGSVALATRLRVSATIIGLTVVAFGTSTPELVVNLTAAWRGTTDLAFGNVVGSNIANLGLLLGGTAVLMPLTAHRTIIVREAPMMLLVCLAMLAQAQQAFNGETHVFTRSDGLILLLFFAVFLYYLIGDALRQRAQDPYVHGMEERTQQRPMALGLVMVLVLGGLAAVIAGGQLTVGGASNLARALGVPEVVIGLTIVAVGTSLPELATNLVAVRRKQPDIAIGNIVGSNIYNATFIFGTTATLAPVPLPAGGLTDLLVMTGLSMLLLPFVFTQARISRGEGAFMLAIYLGYVGWLTARAG